MKTMIRCSLPAMASAVKQNNVVRPEGLVFSGAGPDVAVGFKGGIAKAVSILEGVSAQE